MDMRSCTLCPRMCRVDRTAGEKGFCGMGVAVQGARAALHMTFCRSGEGSTFEGKGAGTCDSGNLQFGRV